MLRSMEKYLNNRNWENLADSGKILHASYSHRFAAADQLFSLVNNITLDDFHLDLGKFIKRYFLGRIFQSFKMHLLTYVGFYDIQHIGNAAVICCKDHGLALFTPYRCGYDI